jgi:suppressor of ftsI/bilirubin oxidase
MRRIGRRRFLKLAGTTALTGAVWALRPGPWATALAAQDASAPRPVAVPPPAPRPLAGLATAATFDTPLPLPGDHSFMGLMDGAARIELSATAAPRQPADDTPAAPPLCLETDHAGRPYWSPTLVIQRGAALRVRLVNRLDAPTLLRWHGLTADWRMGGHPVMMLLPGATFEYRITVRNRAGVYPYHAIAPGFAGRQTHQGMTGLCLVDDEEERAALAAMDIEPLGAAGTGAYRRWGQDQGSGPSDIPLLFQDRRLDRDGVPVYAPNLDDRVSGLIGDVLTVNGVPGARLDVVTRMYRLRLVNMCNARILHAGLARADGAPLPFLLMGVDGGMLERPLPAQRLFLGPGERADILVDLRAANPGDELYVVNLPFDPMRRAGAASGGAGSPGEGEAGRLVRLRVMQRVDYDQPVPVRLCEIPPAPAVPQGPPRRLHVARGEVMGRPSWLLNGQPFALRHDTGADLPDDFPAQRVPRREAEVWELSNDAVSIPHPLHLAGYQMRVLERRASPPQVAALAVDASGRSAAETGIKDTVLVWPGETVKVLVDFRDSPAEPQRAALYSRVLECLDDGMVQDVAVP